MGVDESDAVVAVMEIDEVPVSYGSEDQVMGLGDGADMSAHADVFRDPKLTQPVSIPSLLRDLTLNV